MLLVFPGLAWFAPGWSLSRWLRPDASPLERVGTSLLLGVVAVVPTGYAVAYALRTPLTPFMVLCVSALWAGVGVACRRRWPRASRPRTHAGGQGWLVVAGCVLLAGATTATTVPRSYRSHGLFAPCLHESALIMLEDGSGGGLEVYDPALNGTVAHATARHRDAPGWGLDHILGHQRPGSMATVAQGFAFHGSGALVVMYFLYDLLTVLLAALLIAGGVPRAWAVLLLAGGFLLGVREVAAYAVNENILACGLGLGCLVLAGWVEDAPSAAVLALTAALAAGVRPVAAAWLPALVLLVRWRRPTALAAAAALVVGAAPWLITNWQAFGDPFVHPALTIPQNAYEILGFHFRFHPLNWPVADTLLRGPNEPFPNLFRLPLEHMRAFGVLFCILVVLGAATVPIRRLAGLLIFAAPNYLMLLLIVSLDGPKSSYALLSFPPLAVLVGVGTGQLLGGRSLSVGRRWAAAAGAVLALVGVPALAARLDFKEDPRPQYHTEGHSPADPGLRDRLLTARWLPDPIPRVEQANPAQLLEMLWYGRPPQQPRGAVGKGPVVLWMDHEDVTVTARVRLAEGNALQPMMLGVDAGCEPRSGFAGVSLYLHAARDHVTIQAVASRDTIRLEIDAGGDGPHAGYLTIGLHDDQLRDLRAVDVFLDGRQLAPELLVSERVAPEGGIARTLRVLSNYPWHYEAIGGAPVARAGPDTLRVCEELDGDVAGAPGVRRFGVGPGRCRFLTVDRLRDATPAAQTCRAVGLRPEPRPRPEGPPAH